MVSRFCGAAQLRRAAQTRALRGLLGLPLPATGEADRGVARRQSRAADAVGSLALPAGGEAPYPPL
jgi:hypothetical protein